MCLKNRRYRMAIFVTTAAMLMAGCSQEKENKESRAPIADIEKKPTQKIEIVSNTNPQEIKVKAKKSDRNQSKSYYYDYNIKSEYDPNAKPANEDASVRAKPRTKLDANINIRSPYEHVEIELLVKRLSQRFRVKCSACHDDYANGIIGPSLLSKDADSIFASIMEFRDGNKSNPLMDGLIRQMDEQEIRMIADEIHEFNQEVKKIREKRQ